MRRSAPKPPSTVHKPASNLPQLEARVALDPAFPIAGAGVRLKTDDRITFLHRHDCWELGYCHAGAGLIQLGGDIRRFAPGTVTLIPPLQPHFSANLPGTHSRWTWLMLDPPGLLAGFAPAPPALPAAPLVLPADEQPDLAALAAALCRELLERRRDHRLVARCQVLLLLTLLARRPAAGAATVPDPGLQPALERIARDYATPLGLVTLAAACGLGPDQFSRRFRRACGATPYAYLLRYRIRMAEALLAEGDRAILDIALAVGFDSLSSFNRQFRRRHGCAPRRWRRQAQRQA